MASTDTVTGFGFLKTFSGMAKVAQAVFGFGAMISVAVAPTSSEGDAFIACCVIAIVISAIFLIAHIVNLTSKISLPWNYIEFFSCAFCNVFYIIVSALIVKYSVLDGYVVGAAFGFIAAFMYQAEELVLFKHM